MALAGNEDPRVLLTTTTIPMKTMKAFFLYDPNDQNVLEVHVLRIVIPMRNCMDFLDHHVPMK